METMPKRPEIILKEFKISLKRLLGDDLKEVRLFGSWARGDFRKDSDIDVVVIVYSQGWQACNAVYDIATDMLLKYGVCISPKVISERQYNHLCDIENYFIKNVVREGITV